VKYGTPARGKVVYCKHLAENRYLVGLYFRQHPVQWSTFAYPWHLVTLNGAKHHKRLRNHPYPNYSLSLIAIL